MKNLKKICLLITILFFIPATFAQVDEICCGIGIRPGGGGGSTGYGHSGADEGAMTHEDTQKNLENAGANADGATEKEKKKLQCKKEVIANMAACKNDALRVHSGKTEDCNYWYAAATGTGVLGTAAGSKSFGAGAALGLSAAAAFTIKGAQCQQQADLERDLAANHCEATWNNFNIAVCEQI